jgi:hypothetical protein
VRARVGPSGASTELFEAQSAAAQAFPIDVGDLEFATCGRGKALRDVDDVSIVEIDARYRVIRGRAGRLLLEVDDFFLASTFATPYRSGSRT